MLKQLIFLNVLIVSHGSTRIRRRFKPQILLIYHQIITMRIKLLCLFLLCHFIHQVAAQQKGFFHTRGKEIISPEGKPFLIKGTNLGNWLVPEGYMFKLQNATSPRLINQAFTELIGPAETKKFWRKFQDNYITAGDIHYLKSL